MQTLVLARRYAHALFLQARQESVLEQVTAELHAVVEVMQSTGLLPFLLSPRIPLEAKERVLDHATHEASALLRRFLKLLLRRGRIRQLAEIRKAIVRMRDETLGVERASVTTAVPLNAAQREKLQTELRRLMKKEIILELRLRPKILSGAIVEIGDYLIDGSVEKEIRNLRDRLRRAKVN